MSSWAKYTGGGRGDRIFARHATRAFRQESIVAPSFAPRSWHEMIAREAAEKRATQLRREAADREYAARFGERGRTVIHCGGERAITHRQTVNELVGRFR